MAIAANDDATATAFGGGSISTTINVQSGDMIAVYIGVANPGTWCTGATDDIGNSYTVRSAVISGAGNTVVWAYVVSSAGTDANNEITATFNNADNVRKNITATSWTIDGGDTVTMESAANKAAGFEASPWETASDLTTTGTDELVIAGFQNASNLTYTNHEIPSGTAATGVIINNSQGSTVFYRILIATLTNEEAEVDSSGGHRYACEALAFKSEAAAGGAISISMNHRKIMKNLLTR